MSIQRIFLAAVTEHENIIHAPAERVLGIEVISGVVTLTTHAADNQPATHEIEVSARSLLRALTVAIEDQEAPDPERLDH